MIPAFEGHLQIMQPCLQKPSGEAPKKGLNETPRMEKTENKHCKRQSAVTRCFLCGLATEVGMLLTEAWLISWGSCS